MTNQTTNRNSLRRRNSLPKRRNPPPGRPVREDFRGRLPPAPLVIRPNCKREIYFDCLTTPGALTSDYWKLPSIWK
jgi:hypothetical protein